jgi:cell division protease FtsH
VSRIVPESSLPIELGAFEAVEVAYPAELERIVGALRRALPVLVECDKELTPYLYRAIRDRLKKQDVRCVYLDGRPSGEEAMPVPLLTTIVNQLRDAVRGPVGGRVVVLPHLDLLTTSRGALTGEAREVIPLMYENPSVLFLGFKDPSFPVPPVIERLFAFRESIIGIARERLRFLVTQREARKLGAELDIYALYKHVSGVNAVRLRRLLASLDGEDYPKDASRARATLRSFTIGAQLSVPEVGLNKDIGGYQRVKDRIQLEIIDVLAYKDAASEADIDRIEALIPRGMIFWGPPGTGKTLFAKAMASALGAAVLVVSGPELKSKWVGESEENLRQIFVQARKSAPALIIFDELDSFAAARGTYTGSGVEHSMVNQLLTEMDGFRNDELIFVVGTTNFVESLDPALLRPGRFEFHLHIPYPDNDDRRAILQIYDRKLKLAFSQPAMDHVVRVTSGLVQGASATRYSGDHLQALCRQLARRRLRDNLTGPTEVADIEWALDAYLERPELTSEEEHVVATHEAGHAICALHCPHAPPIDRISIRGDLAGSLGHVKYGDRAHRYVTTRGQLLDTICILFGGREAELMLIGDMSAGSAQDLDHATAIARAVVEELGMADVLSARVYEEGVGRPRLSDESLRAIDKAVAGVLESEKSRAQQLLAQHRAEVVALRDLLLEKKVVDRAALAQIGGHPQTPRGTGGKRAHG